MILICSICQVKLDASPQMQQTLGMINGLLSEDKDELTLCPECAFFAHEMGNKPIPNEL